MTNSTQPSQIAAIQNWMDGDSYKTTARHNGNNTYIINCLVDKDNQFFELDIQYQCERDTAVLNVYLLKEVPPQKYRFCVELINYINTQNSDSKFSLNPATMRLSLYSVVAFSEWEANSDCLVDTLSIVMSYSMRKLDQISQVLEENIGLEEAAKRTVDDVLVFPEL